MDHVPAVFPAHRAQTQIENICDTHNHVFGPFDRFPLQHAPEHTMPLAPLETYLEVQDRTGVARGVLVQPTQQGCDNTDLLHALDSAGNRLRAAGGLRFGTDDATFAGLDKAGVRALRLVEAPLPDGLPRPAPARWNSPRYQSLRCCRSAWLELMRRNARTMLDAETTVN